MQTINQVCWELLDPADPILASVRSLYFSTQKPEEQIPWEWIEGSLERKARWQPGRWCPHLLVTAPSEQRTQPSGFIVGGHVPQLGGYVSYLGVDPAARRQGLGSLLFESIFAAFRQDAVASQTDLPLVIWESGPPGWDASPEELAVWSARMRLFQRVGAYWMDGLDLHSPNYMDEEDEGIRLQLFLRPFDLPTAEMTPARLRQVARLLQQKVYRLEDDDPLVRATFPPGCTPRLASPLGAIRPLRVP